MCVVFRLAVTLLMLTCCDGQTHTGGGRGLRVRIQATADSIVLQFVRPTADMRLQGYILGYGGGGEGDAFTKQFIVLPENGETYQTEVDAEPKYLVAVQPIPISHVKKQCTGKVNLEEPLHLVIGSLSPAAVLLSWGDQRPPHDDGDQLDQCLEDGFYTVRYRERNRKWNYRTCPTSDTVVDNLKPDTPYEFAVRSNQDGRKAGLWSKPLLHNTVMTDNGLHKPYKVRKPLAKPLKPAGPRALFPPRPALHNRTRLSPPFKTLGFPGSSRTSFGRGNGLRNDSYRRGADAIIPAFLLDVPVFSKASTTTTPTPTATASPPSTPPTTTTSSSTTVTSSTSTRPTATSLVTKPLPHSELALRAGQSRSRLSGANATGKRYNPSGHRQHHRGLILPKAAAWNPSILGSPSRSSINKRTNLVGKPGELDKLNRLKLTDKLSVLNPHFAAVTAKPAKQRRKPKPSTTTTTTSTTTTTTTIRTTSTSITAPVENVTQFEHWEESDKFSSQPNSDLDAMGKKRFVAPHVIYKTDKAPDEPCSITSSLNYFPEDEGGEANVTAPPRTPPSNVTVVTVEGCPSFIILDWEKSDNGTTEYEVVSTAKGPDGEQVSVLTTNLTHTAVENLKPDNSYEFMVTPKNDLGSGPASDPVSFSTESADPRVSENVSGKDAIWTAFPFQTDGPSACQGGQYVKRTWYRKFVGVQICNSLRYKIYLSDTLTGKFFNIGDQTGFGEDHCQFVDSFLDGKTGRQVRADQLPPTRGFYRAVRQQPVHFGQIGGQSHINYVSWYECGTPIPGKW